MSLSSIRSQQRVQTEEAPLLDGDVDDPAPDVQGRHGPAHLWLNRHLARHAAHARGGRQDVEYVGGQPNEARLLGGRAANASERDQRDSHWQNGRWQAQPRDPPEGLSQARTDASHAKNIAPRQAAGNDQLGSGAPAISSCPERDDISEHGPIQHCPRTCRMSPSFIVRLLTNAAALWVATRIVPGVTYSGGWIPFLGVALIFGAVNTFVGLATKLLTFPLIIVTVGLLIFVINGLMLWLTGAVSGALGLGFVVDGFWPAFWGALVVTIVSTALRIMVRPPRVIVRREL